MTIPAISVACPSWLRTGFSARRIGTAVTFYRLPQGRGRRLTANCTRSRRSLQQQGQNPRKGWQFEGDEASTGQPILGFDPARASRVEADSNSKEPFSR
ncbi:hypothetical protein [Streptomyces tendae]|uniref:hypothetical protein n=1 Tax=Streptomyces tendae TaxID=1932 RepID=UPI003720A1C9